MTPRLPLVLAQLAILLSGALPARAVNPSFTEIVGACAGGTTRVAMRRLSTDGLVAVGGCEHSLDPAEDFEANRWQSSSGLMALLGFLQAGAGAVSFSNDVTPDGSIIVGGTTSSIAASEAFRWQGGVMTGLGVLASGDDSTALGVNADGTVIVGSSGPPGAQVAFRWTQGGGMVGLPLGGDESQLEGVSNDGTLAVGGIIGTGATAFVCLGTSCQALDNMPGGGDYAAHGVSGDGTVIIGNSQKVSPPVQTLMVRWTGDPTDPSSYGTPLVVPDPFGGNYAEAYDASDDGEIAVGIAFDVTAEAFRWDPTNGTQSVESLLASLGVSTGSWSLYGSTGVSPDGRAIVGVGAVVPETGNLQRSWMAVLPLPNEYQGLPPGMSPAVALEGGLSNLGGIEIGINILPPSGTLIGQYLTTSQQLLGQGVTLEEVENVSFRLPGIAVQAWDIDLVGSQTPGSLVTARFRYDESLLSVPETQIAIFHQPETGPELICSPWPEFNTCPALAVIDPVNHTIQITVPSVPSVELLVAPAPSVLPALGMWSAALLALLLAGASAGVLGRRLFA